MTQRDVDLFHWAMVGFIVFLLGVNSLVHCLEQSYPPRSEAVMEAS